MWKTVRILLAPASSCTNKVPPSRRLPDELILDQPAGSSFEAIWAEDGIARWAGQSLRRHG